MGDFNLIQQIAIWAVPVLFAITLHEAAHGYAAKLFGDDTAARAGRLSLNPLRHVDPVGTILVPVVLLLLPGNLLFGWAKPVPVDLRHAGNPRRDMAWVALAGPAANALMALGWGVLLKLALDNGMDGETWYYLGHVGVAGVVSNLVLMVLNLLPMPPLDGGRVLVGVLPLRAAIGVSRVEPYGMLILILLAVTGVLAQIMVWPLITSATALLTLLGIDPSVLLG